MACLFIYQSFPPPPKTIVFQKKRQNTNSVLFSKSLPLFWVGQVTHAVKSYSEIKEGDLRNATFVVVTQARDLDAIRIVDMCRQLGKFCAVGESRSSAGYFAIDLTDKVSYALTLIKIVLPSFRNPAIATVLVSLVVLSHTCMAQIATLVDGGKGEPIDYEFPSLKSLLQYGIPQLSVMNPGKRRGPPPGLLALRALALLKGSETPPKDAAAQVIKQWENAVGKAPSKDVERLIEEVQICRA